jgi:hypothetical protein
MFDRYEPDGWTANGAKITSGENLDRIREAADRGGIIVRHWFYRGSRGPDIRGFTDFEEFEEYLAQHARPGDAFDVWSFSAVCDFDHALTSGKLPDSDGTVPLRGAY